MSTTNDNELDELSGGSFLSKILFVFHWFVFIVAILLFIVGRWKLGIITVGIGLLMIFISYRIAGGRRNLGIWKDKDLYELLKHAFLTGDVRIGFHTTGDEKFLLAELESIGLTKEPSEDTRQFISDKIVDRRQVFDTLRDHIIIQMIHKGEVWFWDGYGKKKTAQYSHKAKIIFDLKSSANYIFFEVLEDLRSEDLKKKID